MYNNIRGIRIGDYIQMSPTKFTRVTHIHPDGQIQTGGGSGSGGYYLGDGHMSYSGGLDSGFYITDLIETDKQKLGGVWFFHNDFATAGGGVDFNMMFRVFKLKNKDIEWSPTLMENNGKLIWVDKSGSRYTITNKNSKPTKNSKIIYDHYEAKEKIGLSRY